MPERVNQLSSGNNNVLTNFLADPSQETASSSSLPEKHSHQSEDKSVSIKTLDVLLGNSKC